MFFLSYAEEDWEDARQVTAMLRDHGVYTWSWQDHRGGRFIEEIENAIKQADGFIALMSPYFLESDWCREERELAFQREHDLRAVNPGQVFVYVLEVADTPPHEAGFLRGRDWLDMKSQGTTRDETLAILVARLIPPEEPRGGGGADHSATPALGQGVSLFRNRQDELESVRRGLANMAGPHFWLVIAPPQLGKTWFLDQLNAEIAGSQVPGWQTQLVDLRMLPAEQCRDPGSLIARLFAPLIGGGRALPLTIARKICRSRKSYLCLLDGGELLPEETVDQLRSELGIIYQYVQEARITDVRLALVVAARGEQGWRGVAPDPRLSVLPLTEFKIDVVLHALNDLAIGTGRTLSLPELRRVAERVHDLSEGLPALLVPCLEWIQSQEWLETEALETGALFSEIAHPYIEKRLLARDSLHPEAADARQPGSAGEPLRALTEALRLLAPYRMFTQAHLRHHAEFDPPLAAAMATLDWSVERLWGAISGCALLLRPLDEPWQELCPAIRRLLYRYFYSSVQERSRVHHEARKFVEVWARELKGKEQVIGLVECLWHEACEVRLTRGAEMTERLCDSAGKLSRALKPSEAYTVAELRVFAADRIRNDREFRQVLNDNVGLFSRLASIVRYPAGQ